MYLLNLAKVDSTCHIASPFTINVKPNEPGARWTTSMLVPCVFRVLLTRAKHNALDEEDRARADERITVASSRCRGSMPESSVWLEKEPHTGG